MAYRADHIGEISRIWTIPETGFSLLSKSEAVQKARSDDQSKQQLDQDAKGEAEMKHQWRDRHAKLHQKQHAHVYMKGAEEMGDRVIFPHCTMTLRYSDIRCGWGHSMQLLVW